MSKIIIVLVVPFFLLNCKAKSNKYWQKETIKVEHCRDKWVYKDLDKEIYLKALWYNQKKNIDIYSFPNFVIGVTNLGDTIAIMDKNFEGNIKTGDKIIALPLQWTNSEKEIKKPLFTVSPKQSVNDLFCKVKVVYYSMISNLSSSTDTLKGSLKLR